MLCSEAGDERVSEQGRAVRARARRLRLRHTAAPPGPREGGAGAGLREGRSHGGAPRPGRGPNGERGPHRLSWGRRRRQALTSAGGALPALRHSAGAQSLGGWRWGCLGGWPPDSQPAPQGPGGGSLGSRCLQLRALFCVSTLQAWWWRDPGPGTRPALPSLGTAAWRAAPILGRGAGGPSRADGGGDAPSDRTAV